MNTLKIYLLMGWTLLAIILLALYLVNRSRLKSLYGLKKKSDLKRQERNGLTLPAIPEDAVAYIAQNPIDSKELTIATFNKDMYISKDNGANWTKIADQGEGVSISK